MLDRLESISRVLCIGLGALLLLQLVNAVWHGDPLGNVTVPDLPTLPATAASTNNLPADKPVMSGRTNSTKSTLSTPSIKTNSGTNLTAAASVRTNSVSLTNTAASGKTNSEPIVKIGRRHPGMPGGMPGKKIDLPPAIQARVDRIVQSEILGPFIRPMPMALLGIAGEDAFLRSPDGQTGMVKEGAELGAIKLLRIGTNRVLVEDNGEKKELTLFAGMGGESLLPPKTNSAPMTNAPITKKETH
jgi:hypothetical protein